MRQNELGIWFKEVNFRSFRCEDSRVSILRETDMMIQESCILHLGNNHKSCNDVGGGLPAMLEIAIKAKVGNLCYNVTSSYPLFSLHFDP
jgi:hypothetical protein